MKTISQNNPVETTILANSITRQGLPPPPSLTHTHTHTHTHTDTHTHTHRLPSPNSLESCEGWNHRTSITSCKARLIQRLIKAEYPVYSLERSGTPRPVRPGGWGVRQDYCNRSPGREVKHNDHIDRSQVKLLGTVFIRLFSSECETTDK